MTSSAGAKDRYTVAGLMRHLARVQPDHEMFVAGDERRTWGQEYAAACRVASGAPIRPSARSTGPRVSGPRPDRPI